MYRNNTKRIHGPFCRSSLTICALMCILNCSPERCTGWILVPRVSILLIINCLSFCSLHKTMYRIIHGPLLSPCVCLFTFLLFCVPSSPFSSYFANATRTIFLNAYMRGLDDNADAKICSSTSIEHVFSHNIRRTKRDETPRPCIASLCHVRGRLFCLRFSPFLTLFFPRQK